MLVGDPVSFCFEAGLDDIFYDDGERLTENELVAACRNYAHYSLIFNWCPCSLLLLLNKLILFTFNFFLFGTAPGGFSHALFLTCP